MVLKPIWDCCCTSWGGNHKITLIDEPEAFLHPPQATRLGRVLAERTTVGQQVFIATHSSDIVRGALEADANITIVRITRDGEVNHAAVLPADDVRELWNDPLLRYSNVLDGLFHDAVVLCEGDGDCRYYASVLDAINDSEEYKMTGRPPQILFTHCGGKARMHSVIKALRAASVPVIAVPDFDVLRDSSDVKRIVEALGGDFSSVEGWLTSVATAIEKNEKPVPKLALRVAINEALDQVPERDVGRKQMEGLRRVLKAESGWDKVKDAGQKAVPGGDPSRDCKELLAALTAIGMHIVPVGRLERFVPQVAGHGPRWVTEVHNHKLHEDLHNRDAVEFVKGIRDAAASGPNVPGKTKTTKTA
jgi:hypothetical protein